MIYSCCLESAQWSMSPTQDSENPRRQRKCEYMKPEVCCSAPESVLTSLFFPHEHGKQGQVAALQNKSGIALKLSKWWRCLLIFISATIKTSLRVKTTAHLALKHSDGHKHLRVLTLLVLSGVVCVLRVTIEIGTTIVKTKISLTGSLPFRMTEKALTWYTYPGSKLILASVTYSGTIRLTLDMFVC